jgi:hypothetical protein
LEITGGKGVDVVYDPVVRSIQHINRTVSCQRRNIGALELIFYFLVFAGPDRTQLEMRQVES